MLEKVFCSFVRVFFYVFVEILESENQARAV